MNPSADIKKIDRQFIPNNFIVTNWEALQPFFDELVVSRTEGIGFCDRGGWGRSTPYYGVFSADFAGVDDL